MKQIRARQNKPTQPEAFLQTVRVEFRLTLELDLAEALRRGEFTR